MPAGFLNNIEQHSASPSPSISPGASQPGETNTDSDDFYRSPQLLHQNSQREGEESNLRAEVQRLRTRCEMLETELTETKVQLKEQREMASQPCAACKSLQNQCTYLEESLQTVNKELDACKLSAQHQLLQTPQQTAPSPGVISSPFVSRIHENIHADVESLQQEAELVVGNTNGSVSSEAQSVVERAVRLKNDIRVLQSLCRDASRSKLVTSMGALENVTDYMQSLQSEVCATKLASKEEQVIESLMPIFDEVSSNFAIQVPNWAC